MKRLAILGASGHGKVVADCAECSGWDEIIFFDDAWPNMVKNSAWNVIGDTNLLLNTIAEYDGVIVAIGDNRIRLEKLHILQSINAPLTNIIHPKALISRHVELGIGCVVMPGVVINIDTKMGDACIVNTGATVDHDCLIGNGVHICPGAHLAGNVTLADGAWIGIGVIVRQSLTIGINTMVGAGSVVINDIAEYCIVAGVPAKNLNEKKQC